MTITAVMIDSREPAWMQKLQFGGVPTMVVALETGDIVAMCDDGHTLQIERKSPDDFLGSLRDERLLPQLAHLAQARQDEQLAGKAITHWPYLLITDEFKRQGNKVHTERETGWGWSAVQGAMLSIQEMGIMVVTCAGEMDVESCILRLGQRDRKSVLNLLPPRMPETLGRREGLLASLPGIGVDKVLSIMQWSNGNLAHALSGLSDLSVPCPVQGIGPITRQRIRDFLGLTEGKNLELGLSEDNQEILNIV